LGYPLPFSEKFSQPLAERACLGWRQAIAFEPGGLEALIFIGIIIFFYYNFVEQRFLVRGENPLLNKFEQS
jgi:hypothetical protein